MTVESDLRCPDLDPERFEILDRPADGVLERVG
jgi:hypothetical protein